MEPFEYPPLPPGKDAIRILNVEPGDFYDDPIVCTLTSVAFTDKPRYLALSYTWGDAFPHNQSLPTNKSMKPVPSDCQGSISWDGRIYSRDRPDSQLALAATARELQGNKAEPITINGQPFSIHHNLHLCLLHLRSKTAPLPLWVDALCINQADTDERNAQVALMFFVYRRAEAVVAWLGVRGANLEEKRHDLFRGMASENTGTAPDFLQALFQGRITEGDFDGFLGESEIEEAAASSYWTRLWILQEACLATQLVFLYGPRFWTFESLSDRQRIRGPSHSAPYMAMIRMLDARRAKHTDAMKLENLAEQFRGLACSELKERIYGLVGLANDIRPFFTNDRFNDPVEDHIASLDMEAVPIPTMQRGMGRLRVDYSASFYDIWRDVLKNTYFRVGPLVHRVKDKGWTANFRYQERSISVVRSAGVMQEILGREVGKEFYSSLPATASTESLDRTTPKVH